MISIVFDTKQNLDQFLSRIKLFTLAESLGGVESLMSVPYFMTPADAVEIKVKDDEIIKIDQIEIKAMYTPGHTSDSYSFLMNNYLFSGDTLLINGKIGRAHV